MDEMRRAEIRALIIDDCEDDVQLLVSRLQQDGYAPRYRRVSSLDDFISALGEKPSWDVVISDSGVPRLDLVGALSRLRERDPDLPLIVLSGGMTAALSVAASKAGAAGCFSKDDLGELTRSLPRIVDTAAARRRARATPSGTGDLERLFALSIDVLCVAGLDGYFKRVNPAFEHAVGFSAAELVSRPFIEFVQPDDREATLAEMAQLGSGTPTLNFENRYLCANGTYKWFQWTTQPALAEGLLYTAARDVTDRRNNEEVVRILNNELIRRSTELQSANEELEAFAYSVSHDLRAPLRHVIGFVQLLQSHAGDALDETATRYLRTISDAGAKMGQLIDDLLHFARTSRIPLHMQPVRLDRLVEDARREALRGSEERRIVWSVAALPMVRGDPSLLRIAFVNLLSNAIKFTAPRAMARIDIDCRPADDGNIVVSVCDNGVGFEPEYAHRLFGVFQRLHRDDEFPGTGIGLATTARIIQRHGGRMWAEGKPNAGATFYLTFRVDQTKRASANA
jgi:PAS domain S-box-containing protein